VLLSVVLGGWIAEKALAPVRRLTRTAEGVARMRRHAAGVDFQLVAQPCVVRGDPERLGRAVANVLANALKWSPDGATVEVTVEGGTVVVRDHGPGVEEADLPLVFERFYRSPTARGTAGSGLGLAIVRHVLEAHRGSAEAGNAPGGGAVFTLRFPVS
jgi:two-component system sensor histidine kinase MprB